jgi:acetylglutamate kinase
MGWEALIAVAVGLWEQADKIIAFVKTLGVTKEDIDKSIARNRAARAAQLAKDRKEEWPDG